MHVHVVSGDGEAKYWLEPAIEIARNHRYSKKHLSEIESIIEERADEILRAWQRHFGG